MWRLSHVMFVNIHRFPPFLLPTSLLPPSLLLLIVILPCVQHRVEYEVAAKVPILLVSPKIPSCGSCSVLPGLYLDRPGLPMYSTILYSQACRNGKCLGAEKLCLPKRINSIMLSRCIRVRKSRQKSTT